MNNKLWTGLSDSNIDKLLDEFNSSFSFDFRLWKWDIIASLAHSEMLSKTNIISEQDFELIKNGLIKIFKEIKENPSEWYEKNKDFEDIHSAIETKLTNLIGIAGKRLHTARSRNDQVATDLRLYLIEENLLIASKLCNLKHRLIELAQRDKEILMPGYTHLQQAQPISLGHHWLAHYERFSRDYERLCEFRNRLKICPLGSGALAGTTYNINRNYTAEKLGFISPSNNSLDSVSDRDFVAEHNFAIALCGVHLSQLAEELIIWSSQEFNFIKLHDKYATGSSMMPQKKNPDVAELIRGKSGRFIANLQNILIVLKALPLAYNKDLQEDKISAFDSSDNIKICLDIMERFLESLEINTIKLKELTEKSFLNATDLADYLVKKGWAFRDAYKATGQIVKHCIEKQTYILDLSEKDLKEFLGELSLEDIKELKEIITPVNSMLNRQSKGGCSPLKVGEEILFARENLKYKIKNIEKEINESINNPLKHWT